MIPAEISDAIERGDHGPPGCGIPSCVCVTRPVPVCEEWMGLTAEQNGQADRWCPRCGWAEHLAHHPERRRTMTPDEMITSLSEHGGDAGSDFNDGDLMGWFGWHVTDGILTVTYEPADGNGDPGPKQTASWRLVPEAGR